MTKQKIKVDIVSDVVCPWCYIGKRRIEKAMDALKNKYDFEVEYHPFELNPQMPVEGANQKAYLISKFGGEERYNQLTGNVTHVAAGEGLKFDYSKQSVLPNTRLSHLIIHYARLEGKQVEAKEAFMKAYFEDGTDLSRKENLAAIAVGAGLSKEKVQALLSTPDATATIEAAEQELQKLGISGVPFYIINNKYGVSGAQASESFVEAFENIAAEMNAANAAGQVCDADDKNC